MKAAKSTQASEATQGAHATQAPPAPAAIRGCSSFRLRQLSRRVSQQFDQVMSQVDLKTSQYSLLSLVVQLGPVRPSRLAAAMEMDASTLTRNLRPLMAQGWVQLGPGADGRSRLVSITEAGRAKRLAAQREWKRAQTAFNQQLGDDRVRRLHAVIDECLAQLNDEPGRAALGVDVVGS
jgi:DNA-binding MarR family transcriptional regulator